MKKIIALLAVPVIAMASCLPCRAQKAPAGQQAKQIAAPSSAAEIDKLVRGDQYKLPWDAINGSNIVWQKRVWRYIDLNDARNAALAPQPGSQVPSLLQVLLDGYYDGKYKVYSPDNDRFTTEMPAADMKAAYTAHGGHNPAQVTGYRIKEDWMYLENEGSVVVRILGIAPVVATKSGTEPTFWVYYPDVRQHLASHIVSAGRNMNWDMLLEGRNFASAIDKVSDGTYNTRMGK